MPFSDKDLKVLYLKNAWQGEAQIRETTLEDLMVVRTASHSSRAAYSFVSNGSQTTWDMIPLLYFKRGEKVWFVKTEAKGIWEMNLHYVDDPRDVNRSLLCVSSGTAAHPTHDFSIKLGAGEKYVAPRVIFGCVETGLSGATAAINGILRREKSPIAAPVVFNDYMNCCWAQSNGEITPLLAEKAKSVGAEYFCIDAGWYDKIGDWNPCDEKYGKLGLKGVIGRIKDLGLLPGIWMETEIAECSSAVFKNHPDWFLRRGGRIIEIDGRAFFDFSKPETVEYLLEKIRNLCDLGVRYLKVDYNSNIGAGVDGKDCSAVAGLDLQTERILAFYKKVKEEFGLYIENCSSGAMRETEEFLRIFDIQSVSDIEDYKKMPSIINGSLLNVLPEKCGVWAYPFPLPFYERLNESVLLSEEYRKKHTDNETVFNMVSGIIAVPYLSGRLDAADEKTLTLVRRAVDIYKKNREFISSANPVWPLGFKRFCDDGGFAAQALKRGDRILIAVWRLKGGSDNILIPIDAVLASEIYPAEKSLKIGGGGIKVELKDKFSAILIEAYQKSTAD